MIGRIGRPARAGALARVARPGEGELRKLARSVALAAGAAFAAGGLLATSGYLISRAAQRPPILLLMVTIVSVRAFGLTRAVLRYGERLSSHDLALRQLGRLRLRFFRAVVPLAPGAGARGSGELLSRFVADVDAVKDLYLRVVIPALVALLVLAGASLAAWLMLPAAGLVLLGSLALATVALPWLSGTVASRTARRQAPLRARLTGELIETIDGASELALAGRSHAYLERLRRSDAQLARVARGDALASSAAAAAGGLLAGAGVLTLLCVAIPAVHAGLLSGVLLAALVFLALAAYDSILPLSAAARSLRVCATAAARLHELAAQPAIADPAVPRHVGGAGALSLEHVCFRYAPEQPWVLEDLELRLAPGEHVALTGASGAGKSTLGDLLVRFGDPVDGRVTLDGVDLRELAQGELRAHVALCAQDCHLFNTTIRENLLIGRRDASDAELLAALAVVELDGWALALPQGLDTLVGQNGELVSGGQRRRLALARALLSSASVLILDEPTAHLDAPLARRVMRGVLAACEGRALLAITHDPAAGGGRFDRVLELRGGRVRIAADESSPGHPRTACA
ncbi:MAG TPA: thiol reductant ABC exporter subunit CydC [Solirubrobacteraceae bacterium]|jgi:ATP-binding cassette subfamily C protein CydC/ATP-binding cassette subfamily C protein CydCD|nr:thiol reductant ABC exporter subunit CydC [Solirubrobacteraceae bacterium]